MQRIYLLNRLIFIILMLTVMVVSPGLAQAQDCIPAEGNPLRIGAVFPEGSLIARFVGDAYQGAEAMRQSINACGGVNGRPVEWVFQPAADRESAGIAVQNLLAEGIDLIVGSGALAVREALESASISGDFVYWEVTEALNGQSEWAFTPRPSYIQLGQAAANFAETVVAPELSMDVVNLALVYENRPRGELIARGASRIINPLIEREYSAYLSGTNNLAERIREEGVNVVILGAFDNDADRLWYQLREKDANINAWIHVGSAGYRQNLCSRFGNYDGFISVTASGHVSRTYRDEVSGSIYRTFVEAYLRAASTEPSESAELAASGVYMLLRHILPEVEGDFTAENIRSTIMGITIDESVGLMGEGFSLDAETHENLVPGVVVEQRQQGRLCSIWPSTIATCVLPVQPFPTWRERALMDESRTCEDGV